MNQKLILFSLLVGLFCSSVIRAQVKQVTIIDDLETLVPDEGTIHIDSDVKITVLLGLLSPGMNAEENNVIKTSGFRIQVFMTNDPRTARGEISYKGNLIKEAFPEIAVYNPYEAPNWKLLVGDFMTKEEASAFRQKMQKAFPDLGKEMYIVPDKVNIPIQKNN